MNANGLLDLARFFVSFSENNSDTSLRVWREGDSFRFHLTNNNRGQKGNSNSTVFSPATSVPLFPSNQPSPNFSTPPPVFSPKSPSQNHKPHSAALHPNSPELDLRVQEISSKKQGDDDRDVKLSEKDKSTGNQLHTIEDDQCVEEVGDEIPGINIHDRERDSYISDDPGQFKNPVFSVCRNRSCEFCEQHREKPKSFFICFTHHYQQPHYHEKTKECRYDCAYRN